MDVMTVLIIIALLHCALFFFDTMFRSCSHYPYLYFLQNTGLQIEALRLKWFTTVFNRSIQKWGSCRPKFLHWWFTAGMWFSVMLIVPAFALLVRAAISGFLKTEGSDTGIVLEPVLPGVNLPFEDFGYYLLTLILCSIFHELGHAIAAVREDVRVVGLGVILMYFLPVAYAQLSTEQLFILSPKRQLRVLCAGIWHNSVLAFSAFMLLGLVPFIFWPFFYAGSGVSVQKIQEHSLLLGPTGLKVGDQVIQINECEIKDTTDWARCILRSIKHGTPGYCITSEIVKEFDESVPVRQMPHGAIECCSVSSPDHLCFEYLEGEEGTLEMPQFSCLPGRTVAERSPLLCSSALDCPTGLHCMKPSLENSTKLLKIDRMNGKIVLFIGHPAEVYKTVHISDYVPAYFIPSSLPDSVVILCKYIVTFSAGLGIINIIPCFYLDGQYIVNAVIEIVLGSHVKQKSARQTVSLCITIVGTLLLLFSVIVQVWNLVQQ